MTRTGLCRKAARALIAAAVWISPANMREWTTAMAAESEYIEGSFGALAWAAGCFATALKQLCISILSPSAFEIETEGAMSKFAKISAVVLVVGSALFLFAPTFRQGVKVTASSWHVSDDAWLSKMRKLGSEAEARHDARALAFVAMQINDAWESDPRIVAKDHTLRDKFADEAVQWDANLTWIYYPILSRDRWPDTRRDPNDARWTARLEAWDPNNAAVYAREASLYFPRGVTGLTPQSDRALLARSPEWLNAMDKGFSATKYDSYVARKSALDLNVSRSYGIYDPSHILRGIAFFSVNEPADFDLYAKDFLLKSGADLEAKGELLAAEKDYWKVSHLAEAIQLGSDNNLESMLAANLQLAAGPPLESIFRKNGDPSAADLVAYQTGLAQQMKSRLLAQYSPAKREAEYRPFNAWLVQLSLLGMAIALLLILCSGICFMASRALRYKKMEGASRFFVRGGIVATVLLFTSAVVMYFAYSPYATAFQTYLAGSTPGDTVGEWARFQQLQELPGWMFYWFVSAPARVDFWYTVIAVGAAIVVWILCRYLMRTFRHSAPMQPAE